MFARASEPGDEGGEGEDGGEENEFRGRRAGGPRSKTPGGTARGGGRVKVLVALCIYFTFRIESANLWVGIKRSGGGGD